ncbi:3-hydroxyacyl-CoA dehydrogenase NAD-binding domain-containing protein [Sphingobium sp.]|uniref:3-hydroxyacyl-CoA dehydrogenase family protein n=1 Tax=Sphingobium sp. TaxID=1912891 RepID=UPI0028BD4F11|nr:3-hydroxyacyl-CoA dehydrogenase NAD-binding domain-containing protein [Sphingobium sp.]
MSTAVLRPADWPVAIIGAGRMGLAIGQIFAAAGHAVTLIEPGETARAAIGDALRALTERRGQSVELVANVEAVASIADGVRDARLVIEAAPEKLELKQEIFAALDTYCRGDAILATNTSVIPVTEIGKPVRDGTRVVGTHFWNPPYSVKLVEVVQTERTAIATVETTMKLLAQAGQLPVHVRKDVVGFIGNRMQHALKREAIALVQNGVCDAETVDFVIRNSFGARLGIMGTLEQSDLVGLNLTLDIHRVILSDLDCSREPQRLLVEKVAAGKTGAAVGEGFRTYTPEQREELVTRLDRALLSRP